MYKSFDAILKTSIIYKIMFKPKELLLPEMIEIDTLPKFTFNLESLNNPQRLHEQFDQDQNGCTLNSTDIPDIPSTRLPRTWFENLAKSLFVNLNRI